MTRNKKNCLVLAALLLCACLFGGCAAPPEDKQAPLGLSDQHLISASTLGLSPESRSVMLYFRYGDTGYLAPEQRSILVERNESLEKAIVQALINGPESSASSLSALFPAGTEVLAAQSQGETLFITFNDSLLGRYPDEPSDQASGEWIVEGPLRRRLCLDALAATLTEAGLCSQVQILVYQGANQATSMRLNAGFISRSQDDSLLPVQLRSEERLLTPHNTASLLMKAWMAQDWEALYDLTAREGSVSRPGEQAAIDAFSAGYPLVSFELSCGSVSYDGQKSVITADLTLAGEGTSQSRTGYPLSLIREGGLWKADYKCLMDMMGLE